MKAEIVSIGTELLLGTITDTNASYLAQRLAALGIDCYYISQVGDNLGRLEEVLSRAFHRSDLTVTTGGLGPTTDDLTREAIAAMLGEELRVEPSLEAQLRTWFGRRGLDMPERNLKQATLIPSASAIDNPVGTAPGWWVSKEVEGVAHIIVSMPGVPFEMKRMWEVEVEPRLRALSETVIVSRTLKVLGIGESAAEQVVLDLMSGANPTLAPYAKQDGIHFRITAKANDEVAARALIAPLEAEVRSRLGEAVYGADDDTPAGVVRNLLRERGTKLALVEIGDGAAGSLVPQLAPDEHVVMSVTARDVAQAQAEAGLPPSDGPSVQELGEAVLANSGADLALLIQATMGPNKEREGSVLADAEIVLVGATAGQPVRERRRQHWSTAPSEVPRLTGLTAINMLRLALLHSGG